VKIQSRAGPLELLQRHILPLENSESLKITETDGEKKGILKEKYVVVFSSFAMIIKSYSSFL